MHADQNQLDQKKRNRLWKWFFGITASLFLSCCVIPTSIYLFLIPSLYEFRVGQSLPKSAEVLHQQWDQNGFDAAYRFVISFQDDQARDQLTQAWNLKPGEATRLFSSDLPAWWPVNRIDQINKTGEVYSRVDNQTEQWWSLWVDREQNLIYLEQGRW